MTFSSSFRRPLTHSLVLAACGCGLAVACSAELAADGKGAAVGGDSDLASSDGVGVDSGSPEELGGVGGAAGGSGVELLPNPPAQQVPPGMLTAGIFDDNLSFSFFSRYRATQYAQATGLLPFDAADHQAANALYAAAQHTRQKLDISLVIDTTSSMGDELSYLQAEFESLNQELATHYGNAEQRWSLVVYRDEGDEYVSRSFDFTSDLAAFRKTLSEQGYNGGGDFPEAPEKGISDSVALQWRSGADVARLMFWVADAPHHVERATQLAAAIEGAQGSDIHIYPVASSGIDEFTELTMRSAAQLTLGRYLFLTNDSGIGAEHKEPTLPCYYVTSLRQGILRSVEVEMTGEIPAISEEELIRVGGAITVDGACAYGETSSAYPF